jgi:hypothetical protein
VRIIGRSALFFVLLVALLLLFFPPGGLIMADENVPQGISNKQDEIIQYVAKYVVSSCDGARYQEKIRTRTKYNSYFAFLDARHPYHHYYQYLLDSYRYHLLNSEAVNASGWGGGVGDGTDAAAHQQQLTEEEYYQYYGAYQSQTGGIGFQTASNGGEGSGIGQDASAVEQQQSTESAVTTHSSGGPAGSANVGASVLSSVPPAADGTVAQDTTHEAEAEEEEEEYELVMENGEWVSRKRS